MSTGNICHCGHDWDWHTPCDDSDDFAQRLVCDSPGCDCRNYSRLITSVGDGEFNITKDVARAWQALGNKPV